MIRRARMQGQPTLWLPGVDHASIAAQLVLDKIIAAEGESRASLGRERYLQRMWQFMDETRDVIIGQQRRLGGRATGGASASRWTRAARTRFGSRSSGSTTTAWPIASEKLINWCPGCRTSVATSR